METRPTYEELVAALEALLATARPAFPGSPFKKALEKAQRLVSHAKEGC